MPRGGNHECADLSFAESYASSLNSLSPRTVKYSEDLDLDSLRRNVDRIKGSVALNDPNKHTKAIQSIKGTIENSQKEIVGNIKKAFTNHRRKASDNTFNFWSNAERTSCQVPIETTLFSYSFTLDTSII